MRKDPYELTPSLVKSTLATFLLTLAEGEQSVEDQRSRLCGFMEFEPYAAFSRIDRENRGVITASDICSFLKSTNVAVSEMEMT